MSYFPPGTPSPEPTIDDAPFWEACRRHELRFQRCRDCGRFRHPPAPRCKYCASEHTEWEQPPGEPVLFSFTVVHHAADASFGQSVPYNIAIVNYPDADDVRLISNVVDARPEQLRIDAPLALVWEDAGNGTPLPRYRLLP